MKQPLWKRLVPIVGALILLIVLFGWVLPKFIDYEAVFRAIGAIDAGEWLILAILAVLRCVPEGGIYVAAQPGLRLAQGTELFLVSETLSNVPPGGLDLVSRYQMARSWGFSASSSTSATIASWIFSTMSKLILPITASGLFALYEIRQDELDALAVIALGVFVIGGLGLMLTLRSENLAERVGVGIGKVVRWVTGIFRREVGTDFSDLVLQFRAESADVLRRRTVLGFSVGVLARIASFAVLWMATLSVDLHSVSWVEVFAAFSVVMALTVIPILNIPGVTEVILIGALTLAAGSGGADNVAAAVFVYRILIWLAPIPFGGFAFSRWRDRVRRAGRTELLDAFDASDSWS